MSKKIMYLIGSMENRLYEDVEKEHFYIRDALKDTPLEIIDPLLKEKHNKSVKISLHQCGLSPKFVNEMDLTSVEMAHILYWATADVISEGSEVEFAGGGWFDRWLNKGYFKKSILKDVPKKLLIIVGEKRAKKELNHFQNMWADVKIFSTHDNAINFIKKHLRKKNR